MITMMMQVLEIFYENYKRQGDQTKNFVFHPGPNKSVFIYQHHIWWIGDAFIIYLILDIRWLWPISGILSKQICFHYIYHQNYPWYMMLRIWYMIYDRYMMMIMTYFRYSGYVYDAVWLYARVLDALIRKDKSLVQVKKRRKVPFFVSLLFF